jgi:preprotein translocase SecE subunit
MRQKTWVGLFYVVAALVVALVLSLAARTAFASLRITDTELLGERVTLSRVVGLALAAAIAVGCALWPKTNGFVTHVIDELNKVNWPDWEETKVSTAVVIVTSLVSAIILGAFDITFGSASAWLSTNL